MISSIDVQLILATCSFPACSGIIIYFHYFKKNIDLMVPPPFWVWSKESYLALNRYAIAGAIGFSIISVVIFLVETNLLGENLISQGIAIIGIVFILLGVFAAIFSYPKFIISPLFKDSPSLFADLKDIKEYLERTGKKTNNWTYQNKKK
jgi:hypothetical protein